MARLCQHNLVVTVAGEEPGVNNVQVQWLVGCKWGKVPRRGTGGGQGGGGVTTSRRSWLPRELGRFDASYSYEGMPLPLKLLQAQQSRTLCK